MAALALTLIGASAAIADNIVVDGDTASTGDQTSLALGTLACKSSTTKTQSVWITRNGNYDNANVFKKDTDVAITAQVLPNGSAGVSVAPGLDTTVELPANWDVIPSPSLSPDTAGFTVTVNSTVAGGPYSSTIRFTATGQQSDGTALSRFVDLPVTWSTGTCATNTAPTAPGAPLASANPTQGGFKLDWAASTDTQNNAFTYALEGKDGNDSDFSVVASGVTTNSYTFAAGEPEQGTWVYRVKAVEKDTTPALTSGYSLTSDPVIVDRTAPNAPTASADRDPEYSDGATDWWKDSVTVTFGWNGDPVLADLSPGSGEGTTTDPETISLPGAFTSTSGTATDRAGNESAGTSLAGSIDTIAPVVTCPSSSVVLGTSGATIPWNATDAGDSSGLLASSGTIAVDSATVGATKTVTIPQGTAEDNVGHQSPETACTYQVRYAWETFLQPINDTAHDQVAMSVFKVGSTVPVKFQIKDASGAVVTADVAQAWAAPKPAASCTLVGGDLEAALTVSATTGTVFRWDATSQQYVYNWSTKNLPANTCWDIGVALNDGTTKTVTIGLKK